MKIEFNAIIAASSAAVKIGDEGAIRIMLDVPVSDMAEALKLIAFGRKKVLNVTIEIEEAHDEREN
jgi:hypothetical protein